MTTKNRIRLPNPIATRTGCASHSPPAIAADQRERREEIAQIGRLQQPQQRDDGNQPGTDQHATTRYQSEICSVISSVDA